jgi:hypothetical protein
MSNDIGDVVSERDRLMDECMRLRIERETGVPAAMMASATTEDEARQIAADALAWRGATPPAPAPVTPSGAASYGIGQVSRSALSMLSPEQAMQCAREGRLVDLGVGVPQDTHNGSHR